MDGLGPAIIMIMAVTGSLGVTVIGVASAGPSRCHAAPSESPAVRVHRD